MLLDRRYQNLQVELMSLRTALKKSRVRIAKLENQIKISDGKGAVSPDLANRLRIEQQNRMALEENVADLELQVQKTYTKKQVLIARDKAEQAQRTSENPLTEEDQKRRYAMYLFFVMAIVVMYAIAQGLNDSYR